MYGKDLTVHTTTPFNAETRPDVLREHFITPRNLFFARNHGDIPQVDSDSYRLTINGMVETPLSLSLDDLRRNFPTHMLIATMVCAGNRRSELNNVTPIKNEVLWETGAVSTAEWRGVSLADVLRAVGIDASTGHVAFHGLDRIEKGGKSFNFGGSIPLDKALSSEVLLAYEMNGEPLPHEHGFPLRAVVPGYIGARSVKWLSTITIQEQPSDNYYQARAYKMFPPDVTAATVNWHDGDMLNEWCINSIISSPREGEVIHGDQVTVQGFALPGHGATITNIEVSADGGQTWQTAMLASMNVSWAWCFWEINVSLKPGENQLVVRATDSSGNRQFDNMPDLWNFKGYMNNAWHRVNVSRA